MKISIITATYNCASTLADCLDSLDNQSHSDIEHIVIDNQSSDGTLELLRSRHDNQRVIVSEPDAGIYDALNKGIAMASGEVVGLLHSNDLFAAEDVVSGIAEAFSDPNINAVYGDLEYVSQQDTDRVIRYWRAGNFEPINLRRGWMPPHPTLFLRRSVYEQFGPFNKSYRIAADYDFMLRVLTHLPDDQVSYMPRVFTRMRTGGASNRSLTNIARKSWEDLRALRANRVGGLSTLMFKNVQKLPQFWRRATA
ncbi:glycosyltransferase family 2 protein [Halochromatium glycolicum]|uniref:Glycosyl transferase n=1 Tax=Halochromatium glycolicum TaxID=85075 RepID=A0AAJ0XBG3_9GAMM|nr:glycosyltransferase family 2 protein [Halochromatium glycolicum]MBK1706834.1 glycosyl transferase [Halochromatium glycolicum]